MKMRLLGNLGGLVLAATLCAAPSCLSGPPTLTPEQLATASTRSYAGVEAGQLFEASAVALATLGYQTTVTDADRGVIKTPPKVVVVEGLALQTGDVTSVTTSQNAIAWTLQIEAGDGEASVSAKPRGFANGQPIPETTRWDAAYMTNLLDALFDEIESNLPEGTG